MVIFKLKNLKAYHFMCHFVVAFCSSMGNWIVKQSYLAIFNDEQINLFKMYTGHFLTEMKSEIVVACVSNN